MNDQSTKKILFTIGSLEVGGAETQMLLLLRGLKARGFHCELAVLNANGPLRTPLEEIGVTIHDLGYRPSSPRLGRLLQIARAPVRLWRIARASKPDILQAYLPLTNFIGALAGRLAGVKYIITCRRGLGTHQDRFRFWAPLDRFTNRLSTIVTINSRAVGLDTIERDAIPKEKLVLIRNGLDFVAYDRTVQDPGNKAENNIRTELDLDAGTIGVLSVGNLIPYKGYADLIHAVSRLAPSTSPVRFFIAGRDDGIGPELRALIKKLQINKNQIIFLGPRKDVPRLMAELDMFIMPSHEEGFSNALLEALVAGMPIIATQVGGNPEALDDGRYGTLISPHDPKALASAIEAVLGGLDQARLKGQEAAKECREAYAAEKMVESYIKLYSGKYQSAFK